MTGLKGGVLILDNYEFRGINAPLKVGDEYCFTASSVPHTFQIPNYNSNKFYTVVLGNTSDVNYSSAVGNPLTPDYYDISDSGNLTIKSIVGDYFIYEFESTEYGGIL